MQFRKKKYLSKAIFELKEEEENKNREPRIFLFHLKLGDLFSFLVLFVLYLRINCKLNN